MSTPLRAGKRPKGPSGSNEPKGHDEPQRVQKLIAAAGLGSRREAEEWIAQGAVTVNGKVVKLGDQALETDEVRLNGIRVKYPKKIYLLLHKPKGYVTTMRDIHGNKTVMDLVAVDERVYPVGRLDKDTTGLLILTNDGEFANRVMHPRYELEKTYVATVDKPFTLNDAKALERGVRLKEGMVRARLRLLGSRRVEVTLHQGYNHVVKRLLKEAGYWVRELSRVAIQGIRLNVPVGAYRQLTAAEVDILTHQNSPLRSRPQRPISRRPPKAPQR